MNILPGPYPLAVVAILGFSAPATTRSLSSTPTHPKQSIPALTLAHMPYGGHDAPALYALNQANGLMRICSLNPAGAFVGGVSQVVCTGKYVYGTLATHIYKRTGPKIMIYQFSTQTNTLKVLWRWKKSDKSRYGDGTGLALTVGDLPVLYGATQSGGAHGSGTVFSFNAVSRVYQVLHTFGAKPRNAVNSVNLNGAVPCQQLAYDGRDIFGETCMGGKFGGGVLFRLNPRSLKYRVLHSFHSYSSRTEQGILLQSVVFQPRGRIVGFIAAGGKFGTGLIYSIQKDGSAYHVIHTFQSRKERVRNPDGMYPVGLVNTTNDGLIGITNSGGKSGMGTVFEVRPNGTGFKALYCAAGTLKHNRGMLPSWIFQYHGEIVVENTMGGKGFNGNLLFVSVGSSGTVKTTTIDF